MSFLSAHIVEEVVALKGRARLTFPYDDGAYPRVERYRNVPRADLTKGYKTADEEYPGAKLTSQQILGQNNHFAQVIRVWETLPGPVSLPTLVRDPDKGTVSRTTQTILAVGDEAPSVTNEDGVITEISYQPVGQSQIKLEKIVETWSVPGIYRTTGAYDSETDCIVVTSTQLVAVTDSEPAITSLFTDFRAEPVNDAVKRYVMRVYPSGITGKTIVQVKREKFVYPAILTDAQFQLLTRYEADGTTVAELVRQLNPIIEAERPLTVPHRIVTTFQTTSPTESAAGTGLYDILPQRNSYNGFLFNFITGPVLQDAGDVFISTGSSDPAWPGGGVTETYTLTASTPTKTAYLTLRASNGWFVLVLEYRKLAQGLWAKSVISIPAR